MSLAVDEFQFETLCRTVSENQLRRMILKGKMLVPGMDSKPRTSLSKAKNTAVLFPPHNFNNDLPLPSQKVPGVFLTFLHLPGVYLSALPNWVIFPLHLLLLWGASLQSVCIAHSELPA